MLRKITPNSSLNREAGIGLAETVVAIIIMVLVLTSTAYALASAFAASGSSENFNKAYQLVSKQFAVAKQVSYDKLGLVPTEAQASQTTLANMEYCNNNSKNATTNFYNRRIDVPGIDADNKQQVCNTDGTSPTSNILCPAYDATSQFKGEGRVTLAYSNAKLNTTTDAAGNASYGFQNTGDPGNSQNQSDPVYCAWYQFGQKSGDYLYRTDAALCANSSTSATSISGCRRGGVGTVFSVETNVTWVNASNFDKNTNGTNHDDSNTYVDCFGAATGNCFQAKRVTVTVRWEEQSPNGAQQRSITSSFIRAPFVSDCLPVAGNGFVANATPAPQPAPLASDPVSGVSCGQS